jgi:nicotinate dehydrogenase subunit B
MKSSRRTFLKSAGLLTIGFYAGIPNPAQSASVFNELPESLKRHPNINSWLEVLANGNIRVFTGKMELGQGIRTAIAQVAAEELDMNIAQVEIVLADTSRTPDEGYTAGSGSMEQSAMAVRYAAAAAREKLLQLASSKMNISPAGLSVSNGTVHSRDGKRKMNFSNILNGRQVTDKVGTDVKLKSKADYQLVGKAIPRDDIRQMTRGSYEYVHDLRFPGMVHARVVRPPSYGASLESVDESYVKKNADVIKIVREGSFVGVIAKEEYAAMKAQQALRWSCKWSADVFKGYTEQIPAYLEQLPASNEKVHEQGRIPAESFQHSAKYFKPYIMHGSIGPSCAVAHFKDGNLHLWTHSQGVFPLREAVSRMVGIDEERIRITGVPGSGCYGHNGADDVAAEAALLAISFPGVHVRLQWTREDEHLWEPYGSAMIMQVSANMQNGLITEWVYSVRSDNHSTRPGGKANNLLPSRYLDRGFDAPSGGYSGGAYRNSQPYYRIPNQQVSAHLFRGPLRVSALRSLGAYGNIFAIESFMDELAAASKQDPFLFRLNHLEDPRALEVVKKLRELVTNAETTKGEGIGIAFSRYKNSAAYCAVAAQVSVDKKTRKVKVKKMWAVIDAGEVINLDGVINQTEGGMIQAASWTLMEQVQFAGNKVTSDGWGTYPIMRFSDVPEVYVEVIPRPEEEVLGAGEAAQGPAGAAIANAVYRASGIRMRDLPLNKAL